MSGVIHGPVDLEAKYLPQGSYTVEIVGAYNDGSPAIEIRQNGSPQMRVTVSLLGQGVSPPPGHVYIKQWSENEGIFKALINTGVLADTGERVPVNDFGSEAALARILQRGDTP